MTIRQANFLLVLVTIGWGSSYLFTKYAVTEVAPFLLVAYRFLLAFVVTGIIFWRKVRHTNKETLLASLLIGTILCGVSTSFSYALKYTSASTAAFVISTTVILVPIIMMIITRTLPKRQVIIGAIVTMVGLSLFTIKDKISIDTGMILCLVSAVLYALHIITNNYYAKKHDGLQLGVYQLGFGGVVATIIAWVFEPLTVPSTNFGWFAVVMLGLVCSAFAIIAQSVAQKHTTPESTGFIFSLEPIFAAIFAFIFLQEIMSLQEMVGACLIFAGVLIANYTSKKQVKLNKQLRKNRAVS